MVRAGDVKELQALGDAIREKLGSGVGVLAASFEDGKNALLVVVTDDLRERGVRADTLIKDIAAAAGGKGGGKPHMAQAGIPDAARFGDALSRAPDLVRAALGAAIVTLRAWLRRSVAATAGAAAAARRREFGSIGSMTTRRRRRSGASRPRSDCSRELLARPTTGRESALDLLTVDALVTYALEAAASSPESLPMLTTDAMTRLAAVAHA